MSCTSLQYEALQTISSVNKSVLFVCIRRWENPDNLRQQEDSKAWCRRPPWWASPEHPVLPHPAPRTCTNRCDLGLFFVPIFSEWWHLMTHLAKTASTTLLSPLCCQVQMSLTKLLTLVSSFLKFTWAEKLHMLGTLALNKSFTAGSCPLVVLILNLHCLVKRREDGEKEDRFDLIHLIWSDLMWSDLIWSDLIWFYLIRLIRWKKLHRALLKEPVELEFFSQMVTENISDRKNTPGRKKRQFSLNN